MHEKRCNLVSMKPIAMSHVHNICICFTGGDRQDPLSIDLKSVVFEFRGYGNAQVLFRSHTVEGRLNDVFLVCNVIETAS